MIDREPSSAPPHGAREPEPAHPAAAGMVSPRTALLVALAPATVVLVYGTIYGTSAKGVLSGTEAILSSALIFSGAVQFAILGLLTKGSSEAAVLVTAVALSARNIALGSVIRPALPRPRSRRFLLAWTIVDEAVGLALSVASSRVRVLATAGLLFYVTWLAGTMFGTFIGSLSAFTAVSSAALPVLFVGLASAMALSKGAVTRCAVAAAVTLIASIALPSLQPFLPVGVALGVTISWSEP